MLEKVDRYLQLIRELDLRLVKAVDTHLHADHITGLGALRDRTHCITVMGENTKADVVSMRLAEGDKLTIEGVSMDVLYTPGHTDDSYSFLMGDRVFTGDTLLIRGTGRTDFQNGDARMQYESLFGKLLRLPDETLVFPAHDYKGDTVSTIGEEKRYNPRLQVKSIDEYVALMANLQAAQSEDDGRRGAVQHEDRPGAAGNRAPRLGARRARRRIALVGRPDVAFVDLREASEREKHGSIPGALHAPYGELQDNIGAGGMLRELARATDKRIVFYCAFGERSAMAVQAAQDAGLLAALHVEGGIDAWKQRRRRSSHQLSVRIWLRNSLVRSCCGCAKNSSGALASTICPSSMNTMRLATWRAKPISWVTHQHGHAVLGETHHGVEHLLDHFRVERGGRLVEQHDLRVHAERARDRHALLLAAGQLAGIFVGLLGDLHALEIMHRDLLGLLLRHLAHPDRRQRAVFQHGEMRKQIEMLEHHADFAAHFVDLLEVVGQLDAVDDDAALLMLLQPVDAADHGRFAGAGRPADHDALAAHHLEIDVAQHVEIAVPLVHADDLDRDRHS